VIQRVVAFCMRHHWLVIACALVLAAAGDAGRRALARDIIPDLSEPQIVLVADWMGHPASEVAEAVTRPLTSALDGLPGTTAVRGASMSGMAYVDVVFGAAEDLARGRAAILARVEKTRTQLPNAVRLQVGPEASSTGWVFQYALSDPARSASLVELRRIQEQVLRPALQAIPGVAEVASVGGGVEQIVVEARPEQLRARGLAFSDLLATLRPLLASKQATLDQLSAARVISPEVNPGSSTRLADVALVHVTPDMPSGSADLAGAPAVGGIVIARRDANLTPLIEGVRRTLERERPRLPRDAKLVTVYDRLELVDRVSHTLWRALAEEVGVVVLVILIFLLHGKSALIPLLTLPAVLLLTFGAMWLLHVPATIMSLGAIGIALGMAVDADVVALEACHRFLETGDAMRAAAQRRSRLLAAAGSFAPAILTSLLITALSFLPVFAFTGETGRLLRPLALTKTLVIVSAALVALTLAPALRDRLLSGRVRPELDNPLTRRLVRLYRPFVHFALRRPALTLSTALLALLSCVPLLPRLGGEFFPRVDEGALLFMPTTLPGAPADQAVMQLRRQDQAISQFKEVETVFGKVGRADSATDPAPYSMAETTIMLRPRSAWPKILRKRWWASAPTWLGPALDLLWPRRTAATSAELVAALDAATHLPGWTNAWTAPARARLDMMSTGVRTPVGIRVVASDPARIEQLGAAVSARVRRVPGARSVVFDALGGETSLVFQADPELLARYHVAAGTLDETVRLLTTGNQLGELEQGGRALRVRVYPDVSEAMRPAADQLRAASVRSQASAEHGPGVPTPLALLGRPSYVTRPATVRSERGELVGYVYVDLLDGTDLLGYVERAQHDLAAATANGELTLGSGERIEWTGQYQLMTAGKQRLRWILPLVGLSMLGLLCVQFRSLSEALIVLMSVPFALVGSIWTLFLLGYPLSAPVWVGLLSVIGLAMQTGVVMVVYIDDAFQRRVREGKLNTREDIVAAHAEGTVQRLRPKLMTITTMAASLLPLLWADGAGSEVMKRVAAPMLGGLLSSAFLTLEVLPVLYTIWRYAALQRARKLSTAPAPVTRAAPSWARR